MPAMAGASAALGDDDDTARAISSVNAIQRMGGALGVALAAVVLDHQLAGRSADAFGQPFWWILALGALAFVPAAFLPRRATAADARERPRIGRAGSRIGGLADRT
jgi:hypothetical protein